MNVACSSAHHAVPPGGEAPWYHVVHRGLGRRPVFTSAADIRRLLELLGREAARSQLEVHAYTVLANHCHLLVRTAPQALPTALQRVFSVYSRAFNRKLRRDGAVFGSRPRVLRIRSCAHWRATVAYIDRNPVRAGLASIPARYAFGSAWHYSRDSRPTWLHRGIIEQFVREETGSAVFDAACYERVFGAAGAAEGGMAVVERRLAAQKEGPDPLGELLAESPAEVRDWLERMARRADGGAAGATLADGRTVARVLERARKQRGAWPLDPRGGRGCRRPQRGGVRRDGWTVLTCGLLRSVSRLSLEEVGSQVGLSVAGVHYQLACHRRLMLEDDVYRARAELLATCAMRIDFPADAEGARPGASWPE